MYKIDRIVDIIIKAWEDYGLKDLSIIREDGWLDYYRVFTSWKNTVKYLEENGMPVNREMYEMDVLTPETENWFAGMRPISLKYNNFVTK